MTGLIKTIVGPSGHYHQLKSGQIKYQKNKPVKPIWRILVLDEPKNKLHSRAFSSQPSADEIEQVILRVLLNQNLPSNQVVIPSTVEKLCPGLQEKLISQGAEVYLPRHGFASGSRVGAEWEKFLAALEWSLNSARESMASCEEIAAASGNPFGIVTSDLRRSDLEHASGFKLAHDLADNITRLRGRDPEAGRKLRRNELFGAPLNKGTVALPPQDALTEILRNPNRYLLREKWAKAIWDVVRKLKIIRDAEREQRPQLLAELGASAILYQIGGLKNNHDDFLSSLGFCLRDASLRYQVSLGMKEAFRHFILLDNRLLQALAAKVTVQYPEDCIELSLRGIPAHHHLEKMLLELSGGKVTVIPDLTDVRPKVHYHPLTPMFLRTGWIFHSPYFTHRTPLSPSQCLISIAKAGSQRIEGLLIILALFPKETSRYVPIGDPTLAVQMTELINERLADKRVTCQIGPLETYGDLMGIGQPPDN